MRFIRGGPNLKLGLKNVMSKYSPGMIGIATTCLTETIGDDVPTIVNEFRKEFPEVMGAHGSPALVRVSTPSYAETHMEGFHATVKAVVDQLAEETEPHQGIALFPGFVSPADIRYLKEIIEDFGLQETILPDISLTLDGPALKEYEKLPSGGTPIPDIRAMGGSRAAIDFGRTLENEPTAGKSLDDRFRVPLHSLGMPIGLRESDRFFQVLEDLSDREMPEKHALERGRLIDA